MSPRFAVRGFALAWLMALVTQTPQTNGTGIVAGRVVDASGAPIAAAEVFLIKGPPPDHEERFSPGGTDQAMTDDAGRFVFSNIGAGTYRVEAAKPGWLKGAFGRRRPDGQVSTFELADGDRRNDITITIWRGAVIGGRVADDTGDPLIGAEVRAIRQVFVAGRRQGDTPVRERTDDRGMFRFSSLQPGDYVIALLTTILSEPPSFAGTIRSAQEIPKSYFQTMTATGVAPMAFERATGVVGPDLPLIGSLTPLNGVPHADSAWPTYPTTYHPNALSLSNATAVHVQAGDVRTDVDIAVPLTATWSVSGTLRDANGPAAWHGVHLVPADTGDHPLVDVATAVTDPKGAFTFYGVPAGRYILRVIRIAAPAGTQFGLAGGTGAIPQVLAFRDGPPGESPAVTEPLWFANETVVVTDRAIRELTITMHEGPRVRGHARFEGNRAQPTQEEWRKASVSLLAASGRMDVVTVNPGVAFAADGRFTSASVWPGRYLVRATPPEGWEFKDATYQGRDVSSRSIDIGADLDNLIITFVPQLQTIKGTVQIEPGSSAAETAVVLFPTDSALWVDFGRTNRMFATARVSATGQYSLTLPPAGEYFIVAVPEDSVEQWQHSGVLSKLAPLAERLRVAGDASITQTLQVKRPR